MSVLGHAALIVSALRRDLRTATGPLPKKPAGARCFTMLVEHRFFRT
jgi:hypothetical protein